MYIVTVGSQRPPAAHAQRLGDVVSGPSREWELRGHAMDTAPGKSECSRGPPLAQGNVRVGWQGGAIGCSASLGFRHEPRCFALEPQTLRLRCASIANGRSLRQRAPLCAGVPRPAPPALARPP